MSGIVKLLIAAGICVSVLFLVACGERQAAREAYRTGDYETALTKIAPAAENGKADAQYYLGLMYLNGHGVEPNMIEAYKWFDISRATAFDFYTDLASIEIGNLQEQMSSDDLATAKKLSTDWLASRLVN